MKMNGKFRLKENIPQWNYSIIISPSLYRSEIWTNVCYIPFTEYHSKFWILKDRMGWIFKCSIIMTSRERHVISNHRKFDCLFVRLFKLTSKETSKLIITCASRGESGGDRWIRLTVMPKAFPCHDIIVYVTYDAGKWFCCLITRNTYVVGLYSLWCQVFSITEISLKLSFTTSLASQSVKM